MLARNSILTRQPIRTNQPYTYATWDPSNKGAAVNLSNFNLTAGRNANNGMVRSTIGKSSGKWQVEHLCTIAGNMFLGVANATAALTTTVGADANGWSIVLDDGGKWNNGNQGPFGTAFANGDYCTIGLDMDAGTIVVYKNGSLQGGGNMFTGITGTVYFAWGVEIAVNASQNSTTNFGASAFNFPIAGYNLGLYQ